MEICEAHSLSSGFFFWNFSCGFCGRETILKKKKKKERQTERIASYWDSTLIRPHLARYAITSHLPLRPILIRSPRTKPKSSAPNSPLRQISAVNEGITARVFASTQDPCLYKSEARGAAATIRSVPNSPVPQPAASRDRGSSCARSAPRRRDEGQGLSSLPSPSLRCSFHTDEMKSCPR